MNISKEVQDFLIQEATERFICYVKIWTTSDVNSSSYPSTENQFELGKLLVEELKELNLENIELDEFGYVYAYLPPSKGCENIKKIGFIAHLDTSYAVNGKDVDPVIHKNYDGSTIKYERNEALSLSIKDSPPLKEYIGMDIITSKGDTLLGADDKAGVAEIMAACAAWQKFDLEHGPITICFTPDEEIGRGTDKINLDKLPEVCYTLDGSEMGELEIECFDAWGVTFKFTGLSVHPGYAKGLMINAINVANRYMSDIPEAESPECTELREGFYHLVDLKGTAEEATATMIIRDFELYENERRMKYLEKLKKAYERYYPRLKIELEFKHQYENMRVYIEKEERIINLAKEAIKLAGLNLKVTPIRGGTDGARLSVMGIPTPNIFTGGLLFHSRKEHIPTRALQKASEVLIYLADLWKST